MTSLSLLELSTRPAISLAQLRKSALAPVLLFVLVSVIYTWPIFVRPDYWGIQDWDQHLFYHAAPRITMLEYGQAPLWNPYYVGGTVLLANPQSRVLSPSFLLILLFGEVVGIKLDILLHLVIGLLGTYSLARHYRLDRVAASLAAFVFMLNSMYALNLTVGMTWFLAVAYLPWAFLFFLKALAELKAAPVCALFLALMFFGGGVYPLSITILFLAAYGLVAAGLKMQRFVNVSRVLGLTLIVMVCLGAVKFLPAIEFLRQHPRYIYDYSGYSLNSLRFGLFSRDQGLDAITRLPAGQVGFINGVTGVMDENGMYIGLIPFGLALLGLGLRDRRRLALLLCLLLFLWISFGNRPRLELWSWLHLLPVYNSMRIAQRFRIVFMLCLAVLAGFGLQSVQAYARRSGEGRPLARWSAPLIALVVLIDLLAVSAPIFKDAFSIPPAELPARSETFYQIWELPVYNKEGWVTSPVDTTTYSPEAARTTFSGLYPALLSNTGTINGYETAVVPKNARPITSPDYRGEAYLQGTAGTAAITFWSPNRVVIEVEPAGEGYLVLNQNYYTGWQVTGASSRSVEAVDGLLAVKVKPGDRQVELRYRPASFTVGLLVSLLSAAAGGGLVIRQWRQGRQCQFPGG